MKLTPKENRVYTYKNFFCIKQELEEAKKENKSSVAIYEIFRKYRIAIQCKAGQTLLKDLK